MVISMRGEGDYLNDRDISSYINKAEGYFRMSADRDQHDRACRYNLAAALILKKKYAEALTMCNHILKKDPNDVRAMNNKAIAFYLYGKEEGLDTTQKAIQLFQKALQVEPDNLEVLYNMAAFKQERERLAGAKFYWEKYLKKYSKFLTTPKDNFYSHVYKKLIGKAPPKPKEKAELPQIPAGISLGEDFSYFEKKWNKGNKREYKLSSYMLSSQENKNKKNWRISMKLLMKENILILVLDGKVEIVEWEFPPEEPISSILKRFGSPKFVVRHSNSSFYIYNDRGFSIKEISGKVCSYIWFEKSF